MFNDTKYTRWYFSIIDRARICHRSKKDAYYERHHIIPRKLNGSNDKRNIVLLTAREHYVCHLLLPKMCVEPKHKSSMVFAFLMMSQWNSKGTDGHRYVSGTYATMKQSYLESIRGVNHPRYGVTWSEDRKLRHSEALKAAGVNRGLIRTVATKLKISQTRIANSTGAGNKNPMFGKEHTPDSKSKMSEVKKRRIQERGVDQHRNNQIIANPRSRAVMDHQGNMFPSVSAAGRHYGYKGAQGVRCRIQRGEWRYV